MTPPRRGRFSHALPPIVILCLLWKGFFGCAVSAPFNKGTFGWAVFLEFLQTFKCYDLLWFGVIQRGIGQGDKMMLDKFGYFASGRGLDNAFAKWENYFGNKK